MRGVSGWTRRAERVVWVGEFSYITPAVLDCGTLQRLRESGEHWDWYVYPASGDEPRVDINVYSPHCDPASFLIDTTVHVTNWLHAHGITATLDKIQVSSEHARNEGIRTLIQELRAGYSSSSY